MGRGLTAKGPRELVWVLEMYVLIVVVVAVPHVLVRTHQTVHFGISEFFACKLYINKGNCLFLKAVFKKVTAFPFSLYFSFINY